ncbi:hypothetical protein PSTG_08322 [Puccinia striiformis f. sp. tritici PST-78]|uniref:Uncharacterized protein n=1 Tax=Puccinia striiformis f. sp. tritici PST-78 TaxID=1165861 RepID=A0A0L0VGN4_9BASI|nr:hypothetical protein PSTG_08322 [Puccinia striiformis f. sp. tritici PST-78]
MENVPCTSFRLSVTWAEYPSKSIPCGNQPHLALRPVPVRTRQSRGAQTCPTSPVGMKSSLRGRTARDLTSISRVHAKTERYSPGRGGVSEETKNAQMAPGLFGRPNISEKNTSPQKYLFETPMYWPSRVL